MCVLGSFHTRSNDADARHRTTAVTTSDDDARYRTSDDCGDAAPDVDGASVDDESRVVVLLGQPNPNGAA